MNLAMYDFLKTVAREGKVTTYSDVAPIADLEPRSHELFRILGDISTYEHEHGRPMLSAVVVQKVTQYPGAGFFTLARDLGLLVGATPTAELEFFVRELGRVHRVWSRSEPPDATSPQGASR